MHMHHGFRLPVSVLLVAVVVILMVTSMGSAGCRREEDVTTPEYAYELALEKSDFKPEDSMPTKIVFRVLDELKSLGVKAIEWTGGGSVECHPDYKQILNRSVELGFENALVTNGTLLDNGALQLIRGFDWVRFSVDAVMFNPLIK